MEFRGLAHLMKNDLDAMYMEGSDEHVIVEATYKYCAHILS